MATNCDIKFNENPYAVYFPGQTLSGTVELRLGEVMKVKGVTLQIKGVAEVRWSEARGVFSSVYYDGCQEYMNSTTYLVGSENGNYIDLLPGIHTHRFSCALPPNLVTSLEAEYGHIRYTVKVVLERSWKTNLSYKAAFTVLRHVNMNDLTEVVNVRQPAKIKEVKTFCCGPCRSAPILITAETPISGYVPGQTIAVKIEVDNQSNKKLVELSTKLVQVVTYISQTPAIRVRIEHTTMAKVQSVGVEKQNKGSYIHHLHIPPLPPTNITCRVLTVDYLVEVKGKTLGPSFSPRIRIAITLGTIPFTTTAIPTFDNPANMTAPIVGQPVASDPDAQTQACPVDLPPPSYEEVAIGNRTNIQDEGESNEIGCREYTPRYMVYRFCEEVPSASVQPASEEQTSKSD